MDGVSERDPSEILARPIGASPIDAFLSELHERYRVDPGGSVATYIPELAKADPNSFGICLVTTDGRVYAVGDSEQAFTLQSASKPFVYGMALGDHGRDAVLQRIGVEPTGDAFNAIELDEVSKRPFNPMVNAGAIACAGLVRGTSGPEQMQRTLEALALYTGRTMAVDQAVYRSEAQTGHRNRAIAYMMLNFGMIEEDVERVLDVYFQQCSILATCRDLAFMAATLANGGISPATGKRALAVENVRDVLSVMTSCGMYDYAGEWIYRVGMPAKSGVSGCIAAVVPGQAGIAVFSPRIDARGNSVRGMKVYQDIAAHFGLHVFANRPAVRTVLRREYRGDTVHSTRARGPEEVKILQERGGAIRIVELQGPLFFGSMERVQHQLSTAPSSTSYLILDCKRVIAVDQAAIRVLSWIVAFTTSHGTALLRTCVDDPDCEAVLAAAEAAGDVATTMVADDVDAALEWCEDALVATARRDFAATVPAGPRGYALFHDLSDAEFDVLEPVLSPVRFAPGAAIFREGDPADSLYIVVAGKVMVGLDLANGHRRRLASIGPGVTFGEMALLDGGTRSADAWADGAVECLTLPIVALTEISRTQPRILTTILLNIGRDISQRLRQANAQIRSLA
jgi:glutaminase